MNAEPHFDRWQFDRRVRPVARYTSKDENRHGIGFDDYGRMSTHTRVSRPAYPLPPWANDDVKVRQVILHRLAQIARETTVPTTLAGAQELERKILAHYKSKLKSWSIKKHVEAIEKAGGLAAFFCALIYRAYRLRLDSVAIACQMGVAPTAVRQILRRLNELSARAIFPDQCAPHHHTYREKLPPRAVGRPRATHCTQATVNTAQPTPSPAPEPPPTQTPTPAEVLKLYESGLSLSQIAARLRVPFYRGVYSVLKKSGAPMRHAGRKPESVSADHCTQILKLYADGFSLSRIATRLNTSFGRIRKTLLSNGVILRRPGRGKTSLVTAPEKIEVNEMKKRAAKSVKKFNDRNLSNLIRLYKSGSSIADLKRRYRCYGNSLVSRLEKAGVYGKRTTRSAA